jgi:DMSO/TMAO reductase YedYZ molybdopterin-dependent catalytic subunit
VSDRTSDAPKIRRRALAAGAGALLLGGCDRIANDPQAIGVLGWATKVSQWAQSWLAPAHALAPEYTEADLSPSFRGNGTVDPADDDYQDLLADDFVNWKLVVDGLVDHPATYSLAELRAMPSRTQITRHDCVEGWSCIGQWTGVQLGLLLKAAGLASGARYVVFRCADDMGGGNFYYESVDLADAFHPQTILSYALNGQPLPVAHGAPIRLRVERQLGYKQAKYVMRVQVTDSFARLGGGKGGFWEDQGYAWYAGI